MFACTTTLFYILMKILLESAEKSAYIQFRVYARSGVA